MDIRAMHYDLKVKLNKVDSQQYRNLKVPEIDWVLNEAQEIFIKTIAEPRTKNGFGFEVNQRSIDDIRTLVINNLTPLPAVIYNVVDNSYQCNLPENYLFYVSGYACLSKGECDGVRARLLIKQHDDMHEESPFDSSSFEWREVNVRFFEDGLRVFSDGTFIVESICEFNYIRKPAYIQNAQDYVGGTYNLPDGTVLTLSQDCELPEQTHREIVDIAVLIMTGQMQIPDFQIKQAKVNLLNN
jgi:hypothetical protein